MVTCCRVVVLIVVVVGLVVVVVVVVLLVVGSVSGTASSAAERKLGGIKRNRNQNIDRGMLKCRERKAFVLLNPENTTRNIFNEKHRGKNNEE